MLLSRVPSEELFELVDLVSENLSVAKIPGLVKRSSIRPAHSNSQADFTVCLGHPLWEPWRSNIEQVKQIIVKKFKSQILQIESCKHEINQYWLLHLKLDRVRTLSSIFSYCLAAQSSAACNVDGSEVVNEKVAIVTFRPSNRHRSWDTLRLELFSEATTHLVNTWTSKGIKCSSIEIVNDVCEWCREIPGKEVSAQFAHFTILSSQQDMSREVHSANHCVVDIPANLSINPPLSISKIELKEGCNLLYLVAVLKKKIDTNTHKRVIVIVSSKSLANVQKALALCSFTVPIQVIPVESVTCQYSIEEFSEHLKNLLITQSIKCDESGDSYDVLSMPQVDSSKVLALFNTCIRCNLLSVKSSSHLTLMHEKHRNYLFIQYNIARIAAIVKQYGEQVTPVEESDVNYSALTSDEEWSLVLNYILPFYQAKCAYSRCHDPTALSVDKLIFFGANLARDFGCYYSKIRILKDKWQECPIVCARIHLLKYIQSILIDVMKVIDVDPVMTM